MDNATDWKWWASFDEENYIVGPCDSREQVIAAGTIDFDGQSFWIVEATPTPVEKLLPRGRDMIEQHLESCADDSMFGEDGDFGLSGKPADHTAAFAELDAAMATWFAGWKHLFPKPWAFAETRNYQCIVPAERPAQAAE